MTGIPSQQDKVTLGVRRPICLAGLGVATIAVCWLALSPAPPPTLDTGWDKMNHVLAFAALSWLTQGASRHPGRVGVAGVAMLFLYGILIEAAQLWVPGRSGDGLDLLANAAGIAVGCVAARLTWTGKAGSRPIARTRGPGDGRCRQSSDAGDP